MEISIRDYRDDDYIHCRSLYGELTQYHAEIFTASEIAGDDPGRGFDEYMKRTDLCAIWVAETEGNVIGLSGLIDVVGEEGLAEISPVVVTAASRGKGIGTLLVEYVTEEAKRRKFQFLSIRPELRNEKAFNLYVRLGFNKVGAVELFQDLVPGSDREWKSGIEILGQKLRY